MKSLTPAQLNRILTLLDEGNSASHIAEITGRALSTVSRIHSTHCSSLSKPSGGRPRKLSPSDIHYSIRQITSQKAEHATEVTKTLRAMTGESISVKTVRRALKKAGMRAVVKRKRPLLTKRHRKARMDFALAHKDWTLEDWKRVVWSDETKINRLGSDGRKWVWKKAGEGLSDRLVQGTVKFGGGILMLWGCMLWEGPGFATKIDGRMDADLYVSILEDELQATLEYYGKDVEEVVFQQDNDPKHKSKKATNWFKDNGFIVMVWPPQSADLNPIEHIWHHLKKKLGEYETAPKSIHELWERVQTEWDKIPAGVIQNLIESMPRRVEAVLKAKGGYTKY
jgi:transposase